MFPVSKRYPYKEIGVARSPWYGPVYLTYQGAPERNVKRILRFMWVPPDLRPDQFNESLRFLGGLSHENMFEYQHRFVEGDSVYVASEYKEGRDLRALIKSIEEAEINADDEAATTRAMRLLFGIFELLEYARTMGLVHGWLTPDVIYVEGDYRVYVDDLGLFNVYGGVLNSRFDLGAPYIAPEVRGKTVCHQSDIFAAGVMAYELLGGTLPYTEGGNGRPVYVPLQERNANLGSRLCGVVDKCVKWGREERYEAAGDVACDLAGLLRLSGVRTTAIRPLPDEVPVSFRLTLLATPAEVEETVVPVENEEAELEIAPVEPEEPTTPAEDSTVQREELAVAGVGEDLGAAGAVENAEICVSADAQPASAEIAEPRGRIGRTDVNRGARIPSIFSCVISIFGLLYIFVGIFYYYGYLNTAYFAVTPLIVLPLGALLGSIGLIKKDFLGVLGTVFCILEFIILLVIKHFS